MYQALEALQSGGSMPELPKPEPPGKPKLPDDVKAGCWEDGFKVAMVRRMERI